MSAIGKYIEKLARSPEDLRGESLRHWAASVPGTTPIAEVQPRSKVKVAGVIQAIRIDPREGSGSIEARFIDGTGQMTARWLGRQSMSGIRLGMGLILDGTVGQSSENMCVVLNPDYVLVPGPEHG